MKHSSQEYYDLKEHYLEVCTALSDLIKVAGETTKDLQRFELDNCIDNANALLNRLNDHS